MITETQAQKAKDELAKQYLYNKPWNQYVNLVVASPLKEIKREWPDAELNDWCVLVGIDPGWSNSLDIASHHTGVRIVTILCGIVPHASKGVSPA